MYDFDKTCQMRQNLEKVQVYIFFTNDDIRTFVCWRCDRH